MSKGKVLTTYGYEVSNARGINQDAWEYALKLGRKIKDGEIVGYAGAVQYADGSVSSVGAGYRKPFPVIGAMQATIYYMMQDADE